MPHRRIVAAVLTTVAVLVAVPSMALACTPVHLHAGARGPGLTAPVEKEIAMELVSSAENSSLDWRAQFTYIEDIGDGRGYTGGIIGFCSGTGDMLEVVRAYTAAEPANPLARFIPALERVNGTDSHAGLGDAFVAAWHRAAADPRFQRAQDDERDRVYFDPAVRAAKRDGLSTLGQFVYYDAMVMHGPGDDPLSFGGMRAWVQRHARTPLAGGSEQHFLHVFLEHRKTIMRTEEAHSDTSRVDDEQAVFLAAHDWGLRPPLRWHTYGDPWAILTDPVVR
ncbi:chitosanase [Amnibacterium kyonggiense]|uniref:Chitosanase n=1 Tax=Amnibacterium kyonggiense TaxID=595671 RepID=A0A4R7FLN5_9MICO|nr:chitosanase [Amnibacterium kyonggiense]TDS77288.1 chitosanase [Amnibacterium kyonggiense]